MPSTKYRVLERRDPEIDIGSSFSRLWVLVAFLSASNLVLFFSRVVAGTTSARNVPLLVALGVLSVLGTALVVRSARTFALSRGRREFIFRKGFGQWLTERRVAFAAVEYLSTEMIWPFAQPYPDASRWIFPQYVVVARVNGRCEPLVVSHREAYVEDAARKLATETGLPFIPTHTHLSRKADAV